MNVSIHCPECKKEVTLARHEIKTEPEENLLPELERVVQEEKRLTHALKVQDSLGWRKGFVVGFAIGVTIAFIGTIVALIPHLERSVR